MLRVQARNLGTLYNYPDAADETDYRLVSFLIFKMLSLIYDIFFITMK
jgi:hypothetical protein